MAPTSSAMMRYIHLNVLKRALSCAVAEDGEGDGARCVEDDDQREEDVPGREVAACQIVAEPAHDEVVDDGEQESRSEGEVGAHVRHDGYLG